jgi:DNA primase small subunit
VPIDTKDMDAVGEFDPFDVPTVTELLSEIDEWDEKHAQGPAVDAEGDSQMTNDSEGTVGVAEMGKKVQDWEKTRLKPYVEYFRRFVNGLLADEVKSVKREREDGGGGAGVESMEY